MTKGHSRTPRASWARPRTAGESAGLLRERGPTPVGGPEAQTRSSTPVLRAFTIWLVGQAGRRMGWSHPRGHVPCRPGQRATWRQAGDRTGWANARRFVYVQATNACLCAGRKKERSVRVAGDSGRGRDSSAADEANAGLKNRRASDEQQLGFLGNGLNRTIKYENSDTAKISTLT